MTREQLEQSVPTHTFAGISYVRLSDIPEPYQTEFANDSYGSTCPLIDNEGECHYTWDWLKWLGFRFRPSYQPRHSWLLWK